MGEEKFWRMGIKTQSILNELDVVRSEILRDKLVVVDGLPGCGKPCYCSSSSLNRVELFKYSYEIETQCLLNYFGKVINQHRQQ